MTFLLASSSVVLAADIQCRPASIMGYCVGTANADTMTGTTDGEEYMFSLEGGDVVRGLGGSDILDGGPGRDTLNGGPGDDYYYFQDNWGNDIIADGSGTGDTLNFHYITRAYTQEGVTVDLIPSASRPEAFLGTNTVDWPSTVSIENAYGTVNEDIILGTNGNNILSGTDAILGEGLQSGDDKLEGRGGNDQLGGGHGNDRLTGGPGRDTITGDGCWTGLYGSCTGNDIINAVDYEMDTISCGPGFDTVFYDYAQDRFVRISADDYCEDRRPHFFTDPRV